jgi:hypothetical protein
MDQVRPWVVRVNRTAAVGKGRRRRLAEGSLEGVPRVLCRPFLWWCDLVALVWRVMLWNRGALLWCLSCGEGSGMECEVGLRRTGYAGGSLRRCRRRCCSCLGEQVATGGKRTERYLRARAMAGGNIKVTVPGLGEALGSAAAIQEGAAEGGGVASTQCTL